MTVTALAPPLPIVVAERPQATRVGAVARRVGANLAFACAVPAALFYALFAVAGVWTAMIGVLAWSYGTLGWRALTGRRTSGLLLLTTAVLTCRTLIALAASSPFIYFLQPILTDCLIGTTFLVSLWVGRPIVARLAGDFYPMDAELAARPAISRLFRRLTLLWAVLAFGKASVTMWLLLTQPLETFVPVKAVAVLVANCAAVAATLAASAYVARREGMIGAH